MIATTSAASINTFIRRELSRHTRLCLLLLCLLPASAHSDQTDPELDALFDALQAASDAVVIARLESRIWERWLAHPNPDVARLMELGTRSLNARQYAEALLIFSQLVESFPDYAEAWNKRATLYYLLGEFEQSLADIRETIALEPRHFGALSGMGMVLIQQGKLEEARQAFLTLLDLHPNSPNARENLRRVEEALSRNVV